MKNLLALSFLFSITVSAQINNSPINVCECNYTNLKKTTFSPDLKSLISYEDFKKSGFDFKNGSAGFESLFIKNLDPSNLTIWTTAPINLLYKKNAFGLNLTPCNSENSYFEIHGRSEVIGNDNDDTDDEAAPFDVTIQLKSMQVLLSEKILRRWDSKNKKPFTIEGLYLPSPILISSTKNQELVLHLSQNKGFNRFENVKACMNETEISNTGVEFKIQSFILFDASVQEPFTKDYLVPQIKGYLNKLNVTNVDVNSLSGISGPCSISIPVKNFNIKSDQRNTAIINNDLIIGKINIKCFRTENNDEVLIPVDQNENKKFDLKGFSESLLKLGFEKVKLELDENYLVLYFVKFAEMK